MDWFLNIGHRSLGTEELRLAHTLFGYMENLATYRRDGDPSPFLRDDQGELPIDDRHVTPDRDVGGFYVEMRGEYWEVTMYSLEEHSNYRATGRGISLRAALDDLDRHPG